MEHRPTLQAVERALKLLEGSVLAVEVKHLREKLATYGACEDCGRPHPAWITCEAEAERLAVEKPPDR